VSCLPVRPAAHRIALIVATGAVATSLLSACGAGQIAQTARQVAPIEGSQINRGGIAIRNAEVATPPGGTYAVGGDAPLYVAIATDDQTSDTLTGVTSNAAPSVNVVSLGTASVAATPSASASAAPSTSAPMDVRLAPASLTEFKDGSAYLQLRGLTRTLTPGTTVRVTFSFARAGDVTLDVPVATPGTPGPRPTPSPAEVQ